MKNAKELLIAAAVSGAMAISPVIAQASTLIDDGSRVRKTGCGGKNGCGSKAKQKKAKGGKDKESCSAKSKQKKDKKQKDKSACSGKSGCGGKH